MTLIHLGKSNLNHAYAVLKSELVDTSQGRETSWSHHWQFSETIILKYCGKQANRIGYHQAGGTEDNPEGAGLLLHKTLMCPHLEYIVQFWSPCPKTWSYRRSRGGQPTWSRAWRRCLTWRGWKDNFLRNCWKTSHVLWPKPNFGDSLPGSRQCHCNWDTTRGRRC